MIDFSLGGELTFLGLSAGPDTVLVGTLAALILSYGLGVLVFFEALLWVMVLSGSLSCGATLCCQRPRPSRSTFMFPPLLDPTGVLTNPAGAAGPIHLGA